MLDLNRLKALHAVATYGSVGAAADALMVTPSAVSQQLAKLERETGATLLERNGRGVRLTDAAGLLADHAGRILALVETAEADFEALRGEVVGRLSIAAFPTAARGLLPGALVRLRERHPDLRIQLHEREPERQVREVTRGELDLAVIQDWMNRPMAIPEGLSRVTLFDDVADVILPAGHPLAERAEIELSELAGERWISGSPGTVCHDWLVYTLRAAEVEPDITCMADEYPTQLALVAAGQGCAIIPRLGRDFFPEGVRIVAVRPRPIRRIYVLWRADAARRPAIRAAVDALKAVSEGFQARYAADGAFPLDGHGGMFPPDVPDGALSPERAGDEVLPPRHAAGSPARESVFPAATSR
ncbi:LysR family transcriptional regulator [Planobispora longispora]|uniref:LysR family transcriptional regulator n=1 Tax=Planobispora longispora TaxID=28887 RepID=A0A8J3RJX5_9ACTN|nr:LysR family transcriptional regulator [Planobispora longispora]GIH76304.1 LysR family transcriptional regulator [Planobispora longispora]